MFRGSRFDQVVGNRWTGVFKRHMHRFLVLELVQQFGVQHGRNFRMFERCLSACLDVGMLPIYPPFNVMFDSWLNCCIGPSNYVCIMHVATIL